MLDIPVSFRPDKLLLKKNFYRLSRSLHPDYFTNEPIEVQQQKMKESSELNAAYKTLMDEGLRIKYLLEGYGLFNNDENIALDVEFLTEMMDINEIIFELQGQFDQQQYEAVLKEIGDKQSHLDNQLSACFAEFDTSNNAKVVLADIRDIYLKSRYLLRIHENISTFAPHSDDFNL